MDQAVVFVSRSFEREKREKVKLISLHHFEIFVLCSVYLSGINPSLLLLQHVILVAKKSFFLLNAAHRSSLLFLSVRRFLRHLRLSLRWMKGGWESVRSLSFRLLLQLSATNVVNDLPAGAGGK